ncbi:hypothetical protein SO3561_09427 [Streptomyces olivochromogenes]|uniref:Uncharacterized protein n=1 Tax=Streptomyces olivochromogenes TaxID=1963 RepID=A0A250VUG4_STROL|nr:hypothetical protein SO3561_09427 [Streptomyces olivochromogenes]
MDAHVHLSDTDDMWQALVYCEGRREVARLTWEAVPEGVERYLVQIWPAASSTLTATAITPSPGLHLPDESREGRSMSPTSPVYSGTARDPLLAHGDAVGGGTRPPTGSCGSSRTRRQAGRVRRAGRGPATAAARRRTRTTQRGRRIHRWSGRTGRGAPVCGRQGTRRRPARSLPRVPRPAARPPGGDGCQAQPARTMNGVRGAVAEGTAAPIPGPRVMNRGAEFVGGVRVRSGHASRVGVVKGWRVHQEPSGDVSGEISREGRVMRGARLRT